MILLFSLSPKSYNKGVDIIKRGEAQLRSLLVYTYAGILVMQTLPRLLRIDKITKGLGNQRRNEMVFKTPREVSRKVLNKAGVSVHVKGLEKLPDGPVLFVANHQGLFDILVLLGYAGKPVGFIAKQEIKKLPIISNWMEKIHCVFIDRTNRRDAIHVINRGINNLVEGQSMVIFPEGTRSRGSNLNEFKSGSIRLGTKAKVPIVPVAIDGTYKVMEANGGKIKGSNVHLQICDPILPEQYQEMKNTELAKEIQDIIQKVLLAKEHAS